MRNKNNIIVEGSMVSMSLTESLVLLGSLFIYWVTCYKGIDAYVLVKERKPEKIKKIKLPEELKVKCNDIDFDELSKKQFGECLVNFSNVIIKNFKKEDLTNFYNNINNVNTRIKNFKLKNYIFCNNTVATYEVSKNMITLNKNHVEKKYLSRIISYG